jgi:hypothetical protein
MGDRDHDLHAGPPPIPILTGFLGAGKTTGLNRILAFQHAWGSKGSSVGIEANTHLERNTNHGI